MEVSGRYWRARAGTRDHVFPANRYLAACRPYPRVSARAQARVPVSYPRRVVCSQNELTHSWDGVPRGAPGSSGRLERSRATFDLQRCAGAQRAGRSSPRVIGCASASKQARLMGEHDRLDAVSELELLEEVRDVCLDGRVADVELLADLSVGEAARDQRNTSSSRSVSSSSSLGGSRCEMRVNFSITRLVIAGERSASPSATIRLRQAAVREGHP
jgi:hypothetical protein